jgi:hypothetical protein
MARPISWVPRLHEIRRSVANSVRSVYTREEIQQLFQVQSTVAKELMALLPTHRLGTSDVVEREALAAFLERVNDAEDVPVLLKQVKAEKAGTVRRKLRTMVRRDVPLASLDGLPDTLKLERGRMEIMFGTMDELLRTLTILALILQDDDEEFQRRYEPIRETEPDLDADLPARLEALLEERKAELAAQGGGVHDDHPCSGPSGT